MENRAETMTISQILVKMIDYSAGNRKDIHHLMKVHSYARIIGKGKGLSEELQKITEIAAIVHDIACPLCRNKYGNTNGKYQEADYLVNADESGYSRENILHMRDTVFQTKTGTALLESIYLK